MAPSSDRRAQRNRTRDPSWIPRPRNAFIIFRCEYSREHTQGTNDGDGGQEIVNPTAKTLSKRAAEAWKHLTTAEKDRYKVMADKEREEHARIYPHYRFRPVRRQVSVVRKRQSDPSHSLERIGGGSSPLHSSSLDIDEQPASDLAENDAKASSINFPPSSSQKSSHVSSPASVTQRRPSSVPPRDTFPTPYVPPAIPRGPIRRSKSAAGEPLSPRVPLDHVSQAAYTRFGPEGSRTQPWPPIIEPPAPLIEPAALFNGFDFELSGMDLELSQPMSDICPSTTYALPTQATSYPSMSYSTSPLATVASSLIGWNGEFGPPSPSTSGHTRSSSSQEEAVTPSGHHHSSLISAPYITTNATSGYLSGNEKGSSYEDLERAQALEAYAIGLHNYDMFTEYPDPMLRPPYDTDFAGLVMENALK
ncbi:hypothetical protein BJ138DRAFT_1005635 [Hygrophoropsis aurantiaca]|uniref:Uncharacterized protein n=1 Tax=Hygrophoropsis aurantiaca TaxID=72124 RepID=A0ACB8AFD0_9AGAM|nr:hypothetical protein BJ138DRAFT_1005635 [Hygrophoropsis aurantiaca]